MQLPNIDPDIYIPECPNRESYKCSKIFKYIIHDVFKEVKEIISKVYNCRMIIHLPANVK